jgi:hypothetical protein
MRLTREEEERRSTHLPEVMSVVLEVMSFRLSARWFVGGIGSPAYRAVMCFVWFS